MTKDDVIYRLGRIEKMRKSIEQKIQTLTLDNADDAREGFRLIEFGAAELEGEAQAFISVAEGRFREGTYPKNRRSIEKSIKFEGALMEIEAEAEDICSTAGEAADALEEMEGEEGDEVQGIVDDYLGTIDTSNDAIYKAVGEIKEGVQNHKKYWVSDDRQSDFGAWPLSTSDEEIWADLLRDTGTSREEMGGSIKVGDWTD